MRLAAFFRTKISEINFISRKNHYICNPFHRNVIHHAEIAQLVEHQRPKLRVASSHLVFRSRRPLQSKTVAVFSFDASEACSLHQNILYFMET